MPSIISGYEYDIFISYRHKDNKGDHWVTDFVVGLKAELESIFKEDISIYFDANPHDGLLETHIVNKSLEGKLKCLIFIPIISQTYCDKKSFAWQNEFCVFNKLTKEDQFGRDIKLDNGNVASRILPIMIHDLDLGDKMTIESEIGGVLRAIEFIYKEPGVNRPLKVSDSKSDNLNKTEYRNQLNRVANAVKDLLNGIQGSDSGINKGHVTIGSTPSLKLNKGRHLGKWISGTLIVLTLIVFSLWNSKEDLFKVDNSILVLPLKISTPDSSYRYFAEGITADIISELGKVQTLSPLSWHTSFNYINSKKPLKEIAEETKASYIIVGNLHKESGVLRVYVELVNPANNKILWSNTYEKKLEEVLEIQKEIAFNISEALRIKLSLSEKTQIETKKTSNFAAYDLFLQARTESRKLELGLGSQGLHNSQELLLKSIDLDPSFAEAYALYAYNFIDLTFKEGLDPLETSVKAKASVLKAISLNPTSPENYFILGGINFFLEWRMEEAGKNLAKAWELSNKGTNTIYHCMCTISEFNLAKGNFNKTLDIVKTIRQRDPFYPLGELEEFMAYRALKNDGEMKRVRDIGKPELLLPYFNYAMEDFDIAILQLQTNQMDHFLFLVDLSMPYYKTGHMEKSDAALSRLLLEQKKNRNLEFLISIVYATRGQKSEAIQWLKKAYENRDFWLVFMRATPELSFLMTEPAVQEILKKMDL